MKIISIIILAILTLGCSAHVERKNQSIEKYYHEINKDVANKNVIIDHLDSTNTEGEFIQIDNNYIILTKSLDTLKIDNSKIHSIIYKKSGPNWFVGALAGFAVGGMVYALSGARFDLAGGGKYPQMISIIPALTVVGAVGATAIKDYYKAYIIHK